ncbi:uncharacterized protein LOC111051007 [Nilaparvata lugens]|uniref:uncharacterized protein LOC111051007 n=1 Tax=Nilaparvata lugens TaxID=108931 RepID=UPI00193D5FE2|nr:uncharacterized protein LOC111051007 [Nilaparvata lugens]
MARVCKLKSSDIKVKKARNEFYKYLMELMRTALKHEKETADETKTKKKQMSYKSTWSPDRRTYVAIQPLPNQGALIYMACNARPDLGWDVPAKKKH